MKVNIATRKPGYRLNPDGGFVIENFNFSKPLANFFPGIAGPYGIPIWVFYVNRGQAISSFGTKDKDNAILEFLPANKAWETAPLRGFRTFIKASSGKNKYYYEPFANGSVNHGFSLANRMVITPEGLKLEEENLTLGLKICVEYFAIPNDNFGGLARTVTVTNTAGAAKKISIIDGLPQITPFGTNNFFQKEMSRTIEAWMKVMNLENGVPFYKLAVDPADRPEVVHIEEGNFYLGFEFAKGRPRIIKPIVDPECIFGPVTDFTCPHMFLHAENFRYPAGQATQNKTPCGFMFLECKLSAGEQKSLYSVSGYMPNERILNSAVKRMIRPGYLEKKNAENKQLINNLQDNINTRSSRQKFDLYCRQTYLDNILRGGYPVAFKSAGAGSTIFYLYSRKHGDLERDYNKFQIQPTYLSQGNGNYRDVNQNRRSDVWFNPEVGDENIVDFFNLLQLDGFNPLVVKGATFIPRDTAEAKAALKGLAAEDSLEKIINFIGKPFSPGDLILFIEANKIKLRLSYDAFLNTLLPLCRKNQEAEHGEGFWTDHWTYNLDLLENYLAVYPEQLKNILVGKRSFTFYDNMEAVRPRQKKYVLYKGRVKQLHSVGVDLSKKEIIRKRQAMPNVTRTGYGEGAVYQTTLLNKLLCLVATKAASLDPFGTGIEMEANKPGWYDALNGLPALFGSSVSETMELKRLCLFIKINLQKISTDGIAVTEEVYGLLTALNSLVMEYYGNTAGNKDLIFWDKSRTLLEEYRAKTKTGVSGQEKEISKTDIIAILDNLTKKLDAGIAGAINKKTNIYCTYFINEVTEYEALGDGFIKPVKFRQMQLPSFLEAQVHALKVTGQPAARSLYGSVKKSRLYDKKLRMYKVNADLSSMPEEIGRCRIFTPGWLENESIWLHMEYKYLLEILRSGLYEEFYCEFKNILVPFMKPEIYGRSILENSSFIVSSAFADKNLHGRGFVARLSGSTAEFLSIWLIMNTGHKPFFLNDKGQLNLRFAPVLAGWLFDKKGNYNFNFLGKINVTYHNKKRKDTFGKNAAQARRIVITDNDGKSSELAQGFIPSPYAEQIRSLQVKAIEIYLE